MTFTDIIAVFTSNLAITAITASLPAGATFEQCVLQYKLQNLAVAGNLREMARIMAAYITDFGATAHDNTKVILRASGLKYNHRYGVGYPHADGTNHYFKVAEAKDDQNDKYEALKKTMLSHDWYYHFTDDGRVWRAGENAHKAMVQQCKDLGLSEGEALNLQNICLKECGIKSMEGVASINY
jgi:hypothetical protein